MPRIAWFVSVLACGPCLFPGAAPVRADTTIRHVVTVQWSDAAGTPEPASRSERTFTFGDGYATVEDGDQTLRVDGSRGILRWTDETHRTRLETPLPLRPAAILGDVSALRYLEQPPLSLRVAAGTETRLIAGHACRVHLLTAGTSPSPMGSLWVATDLGEQGARMAELAASWWRLQFPLAREEDLAAFASLPGPVLEYERTESHGGRTAVTKAVCAGVERGPSSVQRRVEEAAVFPKQRITYGELLDGRLGPRPVPRTDDENAVLGVLRKFQEGYRNRDVATLEAWIDELMTPDVFVLGTDGAWPESWEWRGGRDAARKMFERDWRRWGSLRIFEDEMHLAVEGDAAFAAAFATVVREGGDDEASRKRAAARLREYAERDWPSRRMLLEAIADASQVLVQYERDDRFVTPLRAEFGLVRREGAWKLKAIHFSHPASGFRSFRLLNAPDDLVGIPGGRP
jgi:ketosteroid isomerase-like protein